MAAGLAVLALLLQVLIPNGLMVARAGNGATIAICTGHGPLLALPNGPGKPGKSPKQGEGGGICVFAGHGGVAPATAFSAPVSARVELVAAPSGPMDDLLPGRGLAAPPPPSQGPPTLSI